MKKSLKYPLLCSALAIGSLALLIQGAAFADALNYSRPKSTPPAGTNATPPQIGQAQLLANQALAQVTSALTSDWSGKPHAVTAKALLQQASTELGLAHTSTNTGN